MSALDWNTLEAELPHATPELRRKVEGLLDSYREGRDKARQHVADWRQRKVEADRFAQDAAAHLAEAERQCAEQEERHDRLEAMLARAASGRFAA